MTDPFGMPDPSIGVYGIGVASQMIGTGVQNLRAYEKAGLVDPQRTAGGTRLYSADDLTRLRRVHELLGRGLNLAESPWSSNWRPRIASFERTTKPRPTS